MYGEVNGAVIGYVDVWLRIFLFVVLICHAENLLFRAALVDSLFDEIEPLICVFFRFAVDDLIHYQF